MIKPVQWAMGPKPDGERGFVPAIRRRLAEVSDGHPATGGDSAVPAGSEAAWAGNLGADRAVFVLSRTLGMNKGCWSTKGKRSGTSSTLSIRGLMSSGRKNLRRTKIYTNLESLE